jgi:hypothetical protein
LRPARAIAAGCGAHDGWQPSCSPAPSRWQQDAAPDGSSLDGEPAGAVAIGLAVPPLDLADVVPNIAEHYRTAEANHDVYSQVPCYCGCERSIGHRHLADCFVRSDGGGWDAHAAGCAVCTNESTMVRRLLADGADTATIRQSIIAEFGALAPDTTT